MIEEKAARLMRLNEYQQTTKHAVCPFHDADGLHDFARYGWEEGGGKCRLNDAYRLSGDEYQNVCRAYPDTGTGACIPELPMHWMKKCPAFRDNHDRLALQEKEAKKREAEELREWEKEREKSRIEEEKIRKKSRKKELKELKYDARESNYYSGTKTSASYVPDRRKRRKAWKIILYILIGLAAAGFVYGMWSAVIRGLLESLF